ncbi:hypothetical protein [Paraflavitalea sp. CAU 1676]|uniref:hypothetical protein n=1 Tax=Paraflavitalea sp. CAU 1676 TaxID=3032598 RepID=UPI0023DA6C9E|nr:hypothetical protein [Paraflavitalea sp. CAU 1676]MDF2192603.1 hypothetical protein [Paraflavitalea sp. CAU 1676]
MPIPSRLNIRIILISVILAGVSCKKDDFKGEEMSSLCISNVVVGSSPIRLNSITGETVSYGNNRVFSVMTGQRKVVIYSIEDSVKPYYSSSVVFAKGSVYSLFVSGSYPVADTLLIKENIPYRLDSTAGIRVINLCSNCPPVNVTLALSDHVLEFSNLSYRQVPEFKTYSATAKNGLYNFQIRDSETGKVLVAYNLATPRFREVTLVLRGLKDGVGAGGLGVMRVNHY